MVDVLYRNHHISTLDVNTQKEKRDSEVIEVEATVEFGARTEQTNTSKNKGEREEKDKPGKDEQNGEDNEGQLTNRPNPHPTQTQSIKRQIVR